MDRSDDCGDGGVVKEKMGWGPELDEFGPFWPKLPKTKPLVVVALNVKVVCIGPGVDVAVVFSESVSLVMVGLVVSEIWVRGAWLGWSGVMTICGWDNCCWGGWAESGC